ncbi:MAG: hypothetical protein IT210_04270 [Armatimonadetes bacterium]|nr:hypothetical protein [Armatimonadota bacterium]
MLNAMPNEKRWQKGLGEFKKAIELAPRNTARRVVYARRLLYLPEHSAEAEAHLKAATQISPGRLDYLEDWKGCFAFISGRATFRKPRLF